MAEVFDNDPNAPWNEEEEFECPECGSVVGKEGKYCSNNCWEASMI